MTVAVFGFARASTVRLSCRGGQWWSQGTWLTALLWIASLAALRPDRRDFA